MESNGKNVALDSDPRCSGPFVFGGVGTNTQHSFYQFLHQSNRKYVLEAIGFKNQSSLYSSSTFSNFNRNVQALMRESNLQLISNLLGQADALTFGRFKECESGPDLHKRMEGERPNLILLFNDLD